MTDHDNKQNHQAPSDKDSKEDDIKLDMSGEVADPIFDDTLPTKPPTDFIPDPSFDEPYERPKKRQLSTQELQELMPKEQSTASQDISSENITDHDDQRQNVDIPMEVDPISLEPELLAEAKIAEEVAAEKSSMDLNVPDEFSAEETAIETDILAKDEDSLLSQKDPALKNIYVGVGWDMNNFDGDPIDLDLSCFILNKDDVTRVDTDFVFYNNLKGADLAVHHSGDNRTGVGEGDDETININLEALPFEVNKLAFIVTIYMGDEEGHSFEKVKNAFIRIVNADTKNVLARFDLNTEFGDGTCLRFGELIRQGNDWHFHATGQIEKGGLSKIAQEYGLMIAGT